MLQYVALLMRIIFNLPGPWLFKLSSQSIVACAFAYANTVYTFLWS